MMATEKGAATKCRLVSAPINIVVTANELNLSIFKLGWLCQFGIVKPEEVSEGAAFNQAIVNIPTPQFILTILPNRLQIGFPEPGSSSNEAILKRVMGGILSNLPHTPMAGMGMNFDFFIAPAKSTDFELWNKETFASSLALKAAAETHALPRFGSYFSMDFERMRLKIDAKPVRSVQVAPRGILEALKAAQEWMHFSFNYHQDLNPETGTKDALEAMQKYSSVASHANSLIDYIAAI